jgi:hypothetical protein
MEAAIITAIGMFAIALIERIFDGRKFSQQMRRERDKESRERHRRLKDAPLLNLRKELARMATKNDRLVGITTMLHTAIPAPPKEELEKWIAKAQQDFNDYIESGEFGEVLFIVEDKEIIERVKKLQNGYRMAYYRNTMFKDFPIDEKTKTLTQNEELAEQVREIQELINQRLEGL